MKFFVVSMDPVLARRLGCVQYPEPGRRHLHVILSTKEWLFWEVK